MRSTMLSLVALLAALACPAAAHDTTHLMPSQYTYREHSLQKPFLSAGAVMPGWDFFGNAVVSDDFVRLTPDRQAKSGMLWNHVAWERDSFEVTFQFKVHGQGKSLCGDGFAFWYTKDQGVEGKVFGSKDKFEGMAIFFDTYSNKGSHGYPYVSYMINNGMHEYAHDFDGEHPELETSGCQSSFRNLDHHTYARVTYKQKLLRVELDVDNNGEWTTCFVALGISLPSGYHFGVSARTGDLADNHDILSIQTGEAGFLTGDELQEIAAMSAEKTKKDTGIGSVDTESQGHDLNGHVAGQAGHTRPPAKQATFRMKKEEGSGLMGYLLWIVVIAVIGIGGLVIKAYLDKKKKQDRFNF